MDLKISVVVIGRNCSKTIKRTILSIANQDFILPYEILFIDGDSEDNSIEIVKELANEFTNIKIYEQKIHSAAYSRILGIQKAQGEYICFSDGDDWYCKNYLTKMYETIVANDADIVNCSFYYVRKNHIEKNLFKKKGIFSKHKTIDLLFKDVSFHGFMFTKIYKASILKNIDFKMHEDFSMFEDYYMNFVILLNTTKNVCIKDSLYYYDKTTNGITTSLQKDRIFLHLACFASIRYIIDQSKDSILLKLFRKNKTRMFWSLVADIVLSRRTKGKSLLKTIKECRKEINYLTMKNEICFEKSKYLGFLKKINLIS